MRTVPSTPRRWRCSQRNAAHNSHAQNHTRIIAYTLTFTLTSNTQEMWEMMTGGSLPTSGDVPSQWWTSDPALCIFALVFNFLVFMIMLNFIIAIIVEAYLQVCIIAVDCSRRRYIVC